MARSCSRWTRAPPAASPAPAPPCAGRRGARRFRPPRKRKGRVEAALLLLDPSFGLAEPEESEQGQHEDDNQDDPKNRHPRLLSSFGTTTVKRPKKLRSGRKEPDQADLRRSGNMGSAAGPGRLPTPARTVWKLTAR